MIPLLVKSCNNEGFQDYLAGDLLGAQEKYEWARHDAPDDAEAHYNLGLLYEKQHNSERAAQEYQFAISSDFETAYSKLVGLYIQTGDYDSAVLWLTEGLERVESGLVQAELEELAHQIAVWYNNAGAKDGQLNSAQENYKKAIELEPNYAAAHYNLGGLYEELVQLEKARAEYRAAINIDPDFDAAINNLARLQIEAGNHDHAVQLLLRGLETTQLPNVYYL
jgi:tetratricopeptide (TPR) repeat protein